MQRKVPRFTLIELLVVIAILASLLLPLSIAREDRWSGPLRGG